LELEYQPRPPYYVLKTPTLDLQDLYDLMEEAQEVFGIVFRRLATAEIQGRRRGLAIRDWDCRRGKQPGKNRRRVS